MKLKSLIYIPAMLILLIACGSTEVMSVSIGDSGQQIKEIQSQLKNFGYYSGIVDGIYSEETHSAVAEFREQNGISANEVFDESTANRLGVKLGSQSPDGTSSDVEDEVYLLAKVICSQAANEPYTAKVSVGAVILNRVKSNKFPNTLNDCIYLSAGLYSDTVPDDESLRAAMDAYFGADPTNGALFYYDTHDSDEFFDSLYILAKIGKFNFCTD